MAMSSNLAAQPLPSASTIAATESTGTHILNLSGYFKAKLLIGAGDHIKSAEFEAAGHSWRILVYANGYRAESAGDFSLFLELVSKHAKDARACFGFSFVRQDRKMTAKQRGGKRMPGPSTFVSRSKRSWGFETVVPREELEKPKYLKDDTVLIRCDITVLNEPVVHRREDLSELELLCDCGGDDQCTNLHAGDTSKAVAAATGKTVQSHTGYVPLSQDEAPPPLPSASAVAVPSSTGCHVVQISGYSRIKTLFENGKYVSSAEFTEAGHRWRIRCYPNGERKENAGYISLFLHQTDESRDVVCAQFHASLVPHGGKLTKTPDGGCTNTATTMAGRKCVNGVGYFMKVEALEESEYLKDDSFFVRYDITVMYAPEVSRQDIEALQILCDCKDHHCRNLHAVDGRDAATAASQVLKNLFLGCLPF